MRTHPFPWEPFTFARSDPEEAGESTHLKNCWCGDCYHNKVVRKINPTAPTKTLRELMEKVQDTRGE